ncbi:MAG: sensor histidine kinase [Pseudomonadota bacterium]
MLKGSLRGRLFVMIVVPLMVVAAFAAVARYVLAERTSQALYDNTLLAVSLAIARDVVLSAGDILAEDLLDILSTTLGDPIYYRVSGPDGGFVTGYSDPPPLPDGLTIEGGVPRFFDSIYLGEPVRVLAMREFIANPQFGGWVTVLVWQTVSQREALSLQLVTQAAALMAIVICAAGAIVWFGINLGLRPLLELREAVRRRSADDLGPIRRRVPREVRSLVEAMNALFRKLVDAFAAQDAFISNAAHQLRNPIAAVQAQAEAAEGARTEPEMRARVGEVAEAARRASRLAKQLLSMERARGLPVPAPDSVVELASVAAEVTRVHASHALRRGVDVSLVDDGSPFRVHGDPVLLAEAIDNLLDNALRYGCRNGGAVGVAVIRQEDQVRLIVEDDGPGIAAAECDQIFERFHRGNREGADGCGLGLAIVREIAQRHGGSVRAVPVVGGARFELDLPAAA